MGYKFRRDVADDGLFKPLVKKAKEELDLLGRCSFRRIAQSKNTTVAVVEWRFEHFRQSLTDQLGTQVYGAPSEVFAPGWELLLSDPDEIDRLVNFQKFRGFLCADRNALVDRYINRLEKTQLQITGGRVSAQNERVQSLPERLRGTLKITHLVRRRDVLPPDVAAKARDDVPPGIPESKHNEALRIWATLGMFSPRTTSVVATQIALAKIWLNATPPKRLEFLTEWGNL